MRRLIIATALVFFLAGCMPWRYEKVLSCETMVEIGGGPRLVKTEWRARHWFKPQNWRRGLNMDLRE